MNPLNILQDFMKDHPIIATISATGFGMLAYLISNRPSDNEIDLDSDISPDLEFGFAPP